jgi:hypothetical protein
MSTYTKNWTHVATGETHAFAVTVASGWLKVVVARSADGVLGRGS